MKHICRIVSVILITFSLVGEGNADLLAGWEIDNVIVTNFSAGASYAWAATGADTSHVQAWISLGAGVNPSTTASQYGFKVGGVAEQISLAGAIAANHYIEISLVAEAGYELDLTSLSMNGESSGSGADNIALLSSVDGYADGSEIGQLSGLQAAGTGGWDTDSSGWGIPFDFSGDADYQGVSAVSFRIYGWNTTSGSGVSYLRSLSGNDVEVTGTVQAIPEPAVIGLICFAGTVALISRRFIV